MILNLEARQKIEPQQTLMHSLEMQQAFQVLQLPAFELTEWLYDALIDNPLVDLEVLVERPFWEEKEQTATKHPFSRLMEQIEEIIKNPKERKIAESIIGNLNEKGFLDSSLQEIAILENVDLKDVEIVLEKVQKLDPPGVAARSLQESFLLQLEKKDSLAYQVIEKCWDLMLHQEWEKICKKLKCSSDMLQKTIYQEIRSLSTAPFPATDSPTQTIIPDITITEEEGDLLVDVRGDLMPPLSIKQKYLDLPKTDGFITKKWNNLQWLLKIVGERDRLLKQIGQILIKKEKIFFLSPLERVIPLEVKEVALGLGIHPSTVARTLMNKWVDTPKGLFPLNYFFSKAEQNTIKEALLRMIQIEDIKTPYTDEALAKRLERLGYTCSRRTVAKYRKQLHILSSNKRK